MEVRIGVQYSHKELEVDLGEKKTVESIKKEVDEAISKGGGMVWFTDKKGKVVGIPAEKLTYIELDAEGSERRVGFAAP